jgi:hypothetical protein
MAGSQVTDDQRVTSQSIIRDHEYNLDLARGHGRPGQMGHEWTWRGDADRTDGRLRRRGRASLTGQS